MLSTLVVAMVLQGYTYVQTHLSIRIKCVQSFAQQLNFNNAGRMMGGKEGRGPVVHTEGDKR